MSLQVARVKNIPIRLHYTLIIVFFLISWTVSSGFMPAFYPGLSIVHYWIMGVIAAGILFISILLHELAHSILSLRYGLQVRQIILFIFGGVSDIREETKDYKKEFKIAIVGPLTSFGLAAGFFISWIILLQIGGQFAQPATMSDQQPLVRTTGLPTNTFEYFDGHLTFVENNNLMLKVPITTTTKITTKDEGKQTATTTATAGVEEAIRNTSNFYGPFVRMLSGVLMYASIVNALLGGFNLLPAFPLDGGRILRATLVRWKKNFDKATRISVKIGIGISYGLMALGFFSILSGSFVGGMWIIILGWFLQSGAQAYLQQLEISSKLSHARLREFMNRQFVGMGPNETVAEALRKYFDVYRKSEFPVVDKDGIFVGSISSKQVMDVPFQKRDFVRVGEIMTPANNLIVMDPDSRGDEALKKLIGDSKSRIFVCTFSKVDDNENKDIPNNYQISFGKRLLVGMISKTDLLNTLAEQEEYEKNLRKIDTK